MDLFSHTKNALIGLAVGDALGVPVEFISRASLKRNPVTEMIGYGTYEQPPGTWSDDSSLAFCLAENLAKGFDLQGIARNFVQWSYTAYWTPRGEVFDIGNTTFHSIARLKYILESGQVQELTNLYSDDEYTNGNGSLMRILPLLFQVRGMEIRPKFELIWQVVALTHGHIRGAIACLVYLTLAEKLMSGMDKWTAYQHTKLEIQGFFQTSDIVPSEQQFFDKIMIANIADIKEQDIRSDGYVLHSLEASLWCLLKEDTYAATVLRAVNLGEDTDTTGAIVGGLAGLLYGFESIPIHWVELLARKNEILHLAKRLAHTYSS